jgi:serine/threonine protein kinase
MSSNISSSSEIPTFILNKINQDLEKYRMSKESNVVHRSSIHSALSHPLSLFDDDCLRHGYNLSSPKIQQGLHGISHYSDGLSDKPTLDPSHAVSSMCPFVRRDSIQTYIGEAECANNATTTAITKSRSSSINTQTSSLSVALPLRGDGTSVSNSVSNNHGTSWNYSESGTLQVGSSLQINSNGIKRHSFTQSTFKSTNSSIDSQRDSFQHTMENTDEKENNIEEQSTSNLMKELIVMEKIGIGAMSTVYRAFHLPSKRFVAVKRISSGLSTTGFIENDAQQAFLSEIASLYENHEPLRKKQDTSSSRPVCPYIVSFHDAYIDSSSSNGVLSLVLEYAGGGSLQDVIDGFNEPGAKKRITSEAVISRIAAHIIRSLDHLEQGKQLHRDIKPGNILVSSNGSLFQLADFGISKFLQRTSSLGVEHTNTSTVNAQTMIGTYCYMAPERLGTSGSGSTSRGYSYPSDIWSAGLVLFTIATGKFPYSHSPNYWDQLEKIKHESSPLEQLTQKDQVEFSKEFLSFLQSMLQKDPRKRLQAKELLVHPFLLKHAHADAERMDPLGPEALLQFMRTCQVGEALEGGYLVAAKTNRFPFLASAAHSSSSSPQARAISEVLTDDKHWDTVRTYLSPSLNFDLDQVRTLAAQIQEPVLQVRTILNEAFRAKEAERHSHSHAPTVRPSMPSVSSSVRASLQFRDSEYVLEIPEIPTTSSSHRRGSKTAAKSTATSSSSSSHNSTRIVQRKTTTVSDQFVRRSSVISQLSFHDIDYEDEEEHERHRPNITAARPESAFLL